ncbi:MAG: DUF6057 family protein [Prevotellaceae bacterium]|nr:DUF6057 family protein [Prevotellaceae bacterium]
MLKKTILKKLRTFDFWIKLSTWTLFILYMVGYWNFQHYLLENTWGQYGFSRLSIICMLIVLTLLPYSLAHKFNLPISWYSIAFFPSVILTCLLAQEQISITVAIISIVAMAIVATVAIIKPRLPKIVITSNGCIFIIMIIYSHSISNTNELDHYKCKIINQLNHQQYSEALKTGNTSLDVDTTIFQLRATAMIRNNSLGDQLFKYPIPFGVTKIDTNQATSATEAKDIILCNLLLQKKLYTFISQLRKYYDINSPNLPQHYKEAIILYLSKTVNTNLSYNDPTTLANYNDFIIEKNKHKTTLIRSNYCRNLYGTTYFWYYHFFPLPITKKYDQQTKN